jgi:hypothetical protein
VSVGQGLDPGLCLCSGSVGLPLGESCTMYAPNVWVSDAQHLGNISKTSREH